MSLFRFFKNQTANVTVIFAVSALPMCAVGGFAIDFDHTSKRKQKVQAVLDSAVLAAARTQQAGATVAETQVAVQEFMAPQLRGLHGLTCTAPTVTLDATTNEIAASTDCEQETGIMHIVGHDHMPFTVDSASRYVSPQIDVSFVFDVSNSMNSHARLTGLKTAANEAVDILLPASAPAHAVQNTRIAIVPYSSAVNAGPYFKKVTGADPSRAYTASVGEILDRSHETVGTTTSELHIGLYDADSNRLVSEIGHNARIRVEPSEIDNLTVAVSTDSSHPIDGLIDRVFMRLRGPTRHVRIDRRAPFTLHGDFGPTRYRGEHWTAGKHRLRVNADPAPTTPGPRLFSDELDFTVFIENVPFDVNNQQYVVNNTCVWERDSTATFTDHPPGPGHYLAHVQAWYASGGPFGSPMGIWHVGHPSANPTSGTMSYRCPDKHPLKLTNDRTKLGNYIQALTAGDATGGHIGLAWGWYLISPQWNTVFTGSAEPKPYGDPSIKKAIILMSDGQFNNSLFVNKGESPEQAEHLCQNIKAIGIEVFTVAFSAPIAAQRLLKNCATDDAHYFETSSNAELTKAFKEIAVKLTDLRLSS